MRGERWGGFGLLHSSGEEGDGFGLLHSVASDEGRMCQGYAFLISNSDSDDSPCHLFRCFERWGPSLVSQRDMICFLVNFKTYLS
jgi:hypothetical protein